MLVRQKCSNSLNSGGPQFRPKATGRFLPSCGDREAFRCHFAPDPAMPGFGDPKGHRSATICSGKLEPATGPRGASGFWSKIWIKTAGAKGKIIQSCLQSICGFDTTSQCKPPVQTPFCIVMDTVLGLVQHWKSQKMAQIQIECQKLRN